MLRPNKFLFVRPDTYGDIVLFEPVFRLLRQYSPDCDIVMLVRSRYLDIAPVIPETIQWIGIDINPYANNPFDCKEELNRLRNRLDKIAPDIIVAPLYNKTWLEFVVASWYPEAIRVSLGNTTLDDMVVDLVSKYLQTDIMTIFSEFVEVSVNMTEWEKNIALASMLCHQPVSFLRPQLKLPGNTDKQFEIILADLGLKNKQWVACCPAGVANVSIKKWPAKKYGEAVAWLKNEKNLEVCLIGHSSEKDILEAVQEQSKKYGYRPLMWQGNDGEIPLLCGLLKSCEFYFGNDTGTMHIAGAMDKPVVAIYGGGTWPRFKPAAVSCMAIIQELPCVGCDWKCHYSTAPCIAAISVENVIRYLSEFIDSGTNAGHREIHIQEFSDCSIEIIRQSTKNIRQMYLEQSSLRRQIVTLTDLLQESEIDRRRRLEQITDLDNKLQESEIDREKRFKQIEQLTSWLKESEADRNARLERIRDLESQLDRETRRLNMLERTYRTLENTHVVRTARHMGLIRVKPLDAVSADGEIYQHGSDCS